MHCASALSIIGPYRQSPKEGEEEIKRSRRVLCTNLRAGGTGKVSISLEEAAENAFEIERTVS